MAISVGTIMAQELNDNSVHWCPATLQHGVPIIQYLKLSYIMKLMAWSGLKHVRTGILYIQLGVGPQKCICRLIRIYYIIKKKSNMQHCRISVKAHDLQHSIHLKKHQFQYKISGNYRIITEKKKYCVIHLNTPYWMR